MDFFISPERRPKHVFILEHWPSKERKSKVKKKQRKKKQPNFANSLHSYIAKIQHTQGFLTFLLSHFEGMNRLFGSGAFESGCLASSHLNQSTEGCIWNKKNLTSSIKWSILFVRIQNRYTYMKEHDMNGNYRPHKDQSQHVVPFLWAIYEQVWALVVSPPLPHHYNHHRPWAWKVTKDLCWKLFTSTSKVIRCTTISIKVMTA